jgi:hypothetical protein
MVYFDMLGPIRVLSDEDKGRLFLAMLEYGQDGTVPQFDGMLALAWGFVRPKLDKDEEEYNMSVLRRQYATVCRERKRKGEPDISFDEWLKTNRINDHQWSSMVTNGDQWYPTTTTTTNTATATATATAAAVTTNTTTNEDGDGDAESMVSVMGGSLGKGVVFLSQEQMDDLLDRMGIDTFDYYVDKLSRFIIEKKARVKNHYDTILKWWTEDGKI